MTIRPATAADAAAIADVHIRSWQAAYAGVLDAAWLAGLSVERRTQAWAAELAGAKMPVLVAEQADRIVAFISHGDCRDAGAAPGDGEIWTLYARPDAWGTGAGRALLDAALANLARAGKTACTLWVLADNPRGRAFYERAGFTAVPGARQTIQIGGKPVDELRYQRRLGPPA